MNKYESSALESKQQQKYAENVQKNQQAKREKKSFNPLYPETKSVEESTNNKELDDQHESSK